MDLRPGFWKSAGRAALALTISAAFLTLARPVAAQDWFTPEACRIDVARVIPLAYPPGLEDDYQQAAKAIPNPVGRLWRITASSGAVSHLWGTYHTPHPLLLDLPDTFRRVLAEARVVALEFDPLPDNRAELMLSFDATMMWKP